MQRTISPADEIQRRRFSESECDGGLQRASTTAAKTPRLRPVGRKAARPKAPELGVHVDAGGPYTGRDYRCVVRSSGRRVRALSADPPRVLAELDVNVLRSNPWKRQRATDWTQLAGFGLFNSWILAQN